MTMKCGVSIRLVRFAGTVLGVWLVTLAPGLAVTFIPPSDNTAPPQADGGASRGSRIRFIPPQDNSAPASADGGATRIGFIPPPENSAPDQAASGASRVGDAEDIALLFLPNGGTVDEFAHNNNGTAMLAVTPSSLYGLTVSARPTIMAYLPETEAHTAIFSLKDETQSVIYRQVVPLNEADGILRITLPEGAPELSIGEYYQWYVTLQTGNYINPGSPYVTAWIKRVDMALVLAQADCPTQDGLAKAKALAQAGIWYDAAEQLAALQINSQTQADTATNWTEFLGSVGLDVLLEHSFL
ncbi:DUF928 domain-containing protein [Leptothoe sp. LEGE 181152]|nr:DUF928 domain-containing protein [Leptothoe sp. LEGE 181152]